MTSVKKERCWLTFTFNILCHRLMPALSRTFGTLWQNKRHIWNHRRTNKEAMQQRNCLGTVRRKTLGDVGSINQFYSHYMFSLILMQPQITNIYLIRIGFSIKSWKHHSETHIIKNTVISEKKYSMAILARKQENHRHVHDGPGPRY